MTFNIIADHFSAVNERQAQLLAFLLKLNLFAVPLYAMLLLDLSFAPLQRVIADMTYSLLSAAGYNPAINDLLISVPIKDGSWAAVITWDCTAWKSMLAFFALIMSTNRTTKVQGTSSQLKVKALGLAIFLPLIFVANLARIFFMFFYVRTFDLAYYQLVHSIVWSWGMILAVLGFWFIWMRRIK